MQRASAVMVGKAVAAAASAAAAAASAAAAAPSSTTEDEGGDARAPSRQGSPRRPPSPRRRYGKTPSLPRVISGEGGGQGAEVEAAEDATLPGLTMLYRIWAPRQLLDDHARLTAEVGGPLFQLYCEEDKLEALEDLADVQRAIEARENALNAVASSIGWAHGMYVGMMASMLTVFVPQHCGGGGGGGGGHTCSLYENTHRLGRLNAGALALNAFTLLMVCLTEVLIFRRERFLDKCLSYDPHKPANNLSASPAGEPPLLQQHPLLAHRLLWHNIAAGNLARAAVCLLLVNLLFSASLILRLRSAGSASLLALATNTMLLGSKLLVTALVCLRADNARTATSIYKVMRVAFNVVDSNYLVSRDFVRNAHRITWSQVQAEYERVQLAERGDVKAMSAHAQRVMSHIVSRRDSMAQPQRGSEGDDDSTPKSGRVGALASPLASFRRQVSRLSGAAPATPEGGGASAASAAGATYMGTAQAARLTVRTHAVGPAEGQPGSR